MSETISCILSIILGPIGSVMIYRAMRDRLSDRGVRRMMTRNALIAMYIIFGAGMAGTSLLFFLGAYKLVNAYLGSAT